jgi:hypothetical protein
VESLKAYRIGGQSTVLEPAPGIVGITGSNSLRDLRALTADHRLEIQRGVGWQERIDQVTLVATQQGVG